ncbi:MAG: hypothetical protein RBQ97_12285 [Acholeplasma sp.]|nr:hypothetical protein [Acholeplasma sp.]
MQEARFLQDKVLIGKVERLIKRVEFSIFYRSKSIQMTKDNIKSYEKLLRFLENDSNKSHHEAWVGVTQQIRNTLEKGYETIKGAEPINAKEEAFLEELKAHTYTNETTKETAYNADFFESLIPYAEVNGDCEEFSNEHIQLMLISGFIKSKKELGIEDEPKEKLEEVEVKEEVKNDKEGE